MTLSNPPTPGAGDVWGTALIATLEDLDDRIEDVEASAVTSVNGETGAVTLSPADVGADATGTATAAVTAHVGQVDPHPGKYAAASHTHAASALASGTVATARLGSGTASSTTFLRGDQTFAVPTGAVSSVAAKTGAVTLVKADVGLSNVDNTTDLNKPVSTATTAAIAAVTTDDLADVAATAPNDGDAFLYDESTTSWGPVDLTDRFTGADPSTGQTLPENAAPFTLFGFIVDEGDPPPAGLPLGLGVPIIGFSRAAAPSLDPVLLDENIAQTSNNVVLTLPEALAVGDDIGIAIGFGAETATNVPASFTVAYSTGAGAVTFGTISIPNATAGCQLGQARITTLVPSSATITITAKDAGAANTSRAHLWAAVYRLPNVAATPLDVQAIGGGNSSATMTVIAAGPTAGDTAQADEVAIGIAAWNGSTTATRDLAGTNGWQLVSTYESVAGGGSRQFAVFYKVLASVQKPQLTTLMTASDAATGQWATSLATYKGV